MVVMSQAQSSTTPSTGRDALPSNVESCRFCGSDDLTCTTGMQSKNQHSHRGLHATSIRCDDCGMEFCSLSLCTQRTTARSRVENQGVVWMIPDGYCIIYCTECSDVCGMHSKTDETNRELFERLVGDDLHSGCCGAVCDYEEDTFRRREGGLK